MMPGDLLMSILGASFDAGEILFSYIREYLTMPGELFFDYLYYMLKKSL